MGNRKIQYHIPQTSLWNWHLVSEYTVRTELRRTRDAMDNLNKDEVILDTDIANIEQEIRGQWANANANVMRAFEVRLKEMLARRKRLNRFVRQLEAALKDLHDIGAQRKWKM